jgi:hypothetical protein
LVHAVQQPLFPPQFLTLSTGGGRLRIERARAATTARLICDLRLPAKSAERVDVLADWSEHMDDETSTQAPDQPVKVSVKAFDIQLAGREGETTPDIERFEVRREQDFGDTKHRRVAYTFSATTRFKEFFPEGTTPLTNDSEKQIVHIPSTLRPAAPEPLYVVPTFEWNFPPPFDTQSTRTYTHTRSGNGVRVYLKRPWYASGEDEFLGVVIASTPVGTDIPETAEPFLTRMGSDPLWPAQTSARPAGYPRLFRFPKAVDAAERLRLQSEGGVIGAALPLEDAGGYQVNVACHHVDYNRERQLWFADIVVFPNDPDPPYFPFIKLALVRYQPFALDGLNMSSLAIADIAQLAPNRKASMTIHSDSNQVDVEVTGNFIDTNVVKVSLEARRDFVPDESIGWTKTSITDRRMSVEGNGVQKHWRATLPLTDVPPVYRLVIKEYETIESDESSTTERLVYADTFRSDGQGNQ